MGAGGGEYILTNQIVAQSFHAMWTIMWRSSVCEQFCET